MRLIPRLYGGNELGVLAVTAPDAAHPRVEYVGGELFVGLDDADAGGAAVTRGAAEEWSRPFREVVGEAVAEAPPVPDPVGGLVILVDESSAAAVLVDTARVTAVALHGDPVVLALSRDRLAIVGADDEAAVARVLDLAEQLYVAGGPLVSAHPVVLTEGGWAPFPWLERFPALAGRIHRVLRLFGVRAYEAQTVVLRRPDVHVADPKIQVRDDGVTITFAAWPKGTATLLPVADNVVIADPSGAISVATMAQFLDAAGDAVVRTGLSPTRYFVPGSPPRAAAAQEPGTANPDS